MHPLSWSLYLVDNEAKVRDLSKEISVEENTMRKEEENESGEFQNWLDLPQFLLLSILDRLPSLPDFFAFIAVCRTWRSLATSYASAHASRPPLLLHCRVPHEARNSRNNCLFRIISKDHRSYRTKIAPKTLAKRCIGCSYGRLIVQRSKTAVVLADIFTGDEILAPEIDPRYEILSGILTAPLSSPSCTLLATNSNGTVMRWIPGSDSWHSFEFEFTLRIRSSAVYEGQVFCLDSDGRLVVVEFSSPPTCKVLGLPLPRRPLPCFENFNNYRLAVCGGDLLLVLFVSAETSWMNYALKIAIEAYRFDFRGRGWGKVDDLGDWCLFIDPVGGSPVLSCPDPKRWGGRKNCVYVAGPGCESWSVFPVDGTVIDTTDTTGKECALSAANWTMPRWPSPVWVYPSMLL